MVNEPNRAVLQQQVHDLHERFRVAHRAVMASLDAGDLDGFKNALAIEREIIDEHQRVMEEVLSLWKA